MPFSQGHVGAHICICMRMPMPQVSNSYANGSQLHGRLAEVCSEGFSERFIRKTLRKGMLQVRPRDSSATLQDAASAAAVKPRDTPAIGATRRSGMLQVRTLNDQESYSVTLLQRF